MFKKQWVRGYAVMGTFWVAVLSGIISIGEPTWWQAILYSLIIVPVTAVAIVIMKSVLFIMGVSLVIGIEFLADWIEGGEE